MEVECSNSRPPGPDSLTGEEEVNIVIFVISGVIMVMISITAIIMTTITINALIVS